MPIVSLYPQSLKGTPAEPSKAPKPEALPLALVWVLGRSGLLGMCRLRQASKSLHWALEFGACSLRLQGTLSQLGLSQTRSLDSCHTTCYARAVFWKDSSARRYRGFRVLGARGN